MPLPSHSGAPRRDPWEQGHAAIAETAWSSFFGATKVLGAVAALVVAAAGALIAVHQFTFATGLGMALALALSWPAAYSVLELHRLSRCRTALERVLQAEKYTEELLSQARHERDQALADRQAAQAQMAVHVEAARFFRDFREERDETDIDARPVGSARRRGRE